MILTVNTIHLVVPAGFNSFQLDLHTIYKVSNKCRFSYNYFVTREDNKKSRFPIPGDTGRARLRLLGNGLHHV
jgi:hypothetical protein